MKPTSPDGRMSNREHSPSGGSAISTMSFVTFQRLTRDDFKLLALPSRLSIVKD